MFIRRTAIKSRHTGEPYYTYRLVESLRSAEGVRQRTILNLGRHFDVPKAKWGALAQRIEALLQGQLDWIPDNLDPQWEALAQQYAARILRTRGAVADARSQTPTEGPDYQRVDLSTLQMFRPRSVAVEHVAWATVQQLGLDAKLNALGFNRHQLPGGSPYGVQNRTKPADVGLHARPERSLRHRGQSGHSKRVHPVLQVPSHPHPGGISSRYRFEHV